jgi:AAA+ superfamily predicted ATPase
MKDQSNDWLEYNRAELRRRLSGLKDRLRAGPAAPPSEDIGHGDGGSGTAPIALDRLADAFGLSPFERDILLLCAGVELDAEVAGLCAAAQGDPGRRDPGKDQPSFSLALAALPGAHWSALAPDAPLRHWRMVEVAAGPVLTRAALRIDERILHFLVGVAQIDERLASLIDALEPVDLDDLAPSRARVAIAIAGAWEGASPGRGLALAQLGGSPADAPAIAAAAAARLGLRAAALSADRLPRSPQDLDGLLRLWEREAELSGLGVLLITVDDPPPGEAEAESGRGRDTALSLLLERAAGPVILCEREPRRITFRPALRLEIGPAAGAERLVLWREHLGGHAPGDAALAAIADQFSLGPTVIRAVAGEFRVRQAGHPGDDPAAILWGLCRLHLRGALEGLARRLDSDLTWDDLVLPQAQKDTLAAIAAQLRQRATVYEQWGFAGKSRRGLGLSALFHGPSGVGKTMAAEVLANALKLDLYHIDLSRIVSKYIGETETNLRRVFDAAEENGAILLFDEADSLFGARSEVKDSHDRYANIEVSYLLQRMEAYRGLAILTTNMRAALDPAFLRRIRFSIGFPFPDVAQRGEIWRKVFPPGAPTEGLDFDRLAQLGIAGGNIRNIALNAAFLAADEGAAIAMDHVLRAARSEYAKLDRRFTQSESAIWA